MEFHNEESKIRSINSKSSSKSRYAKMIAITSGKGGVGKSNFILNLAISMSIRNKKVLLIDADMNLSNLDILLGLYPQHTLSDLLNDEITVDNLLVEGPKGVKILPAASGDIRVMQNSSKLQKALIQVYKELRKDFDFILIDTGAGISENTMEFVYTADKIVIITTPEPTAITDAYAMMKMLFYHMRAPDMSVVINMAHTDNEAENIFKKISQILQHFLNKQVSYLGNVLYDKHLPESVKEQIPLILKHPRSSASANIHNIAIKIMKQYK